MVVSIIVAVSENNVIGKDNDLIWHLPDDMDFFKKTTRGHCILTGRRNYNSIPKKFRPLPGRTNIVVSRGEFQNEPNLIYVKSIDEGIKIAADKQEEELFIIGGGEIYRQSLNVVDKIYLTRVHGEFDGDTFFPELDESVWKEISSVFHPADEKHKYDMTFLQFGKE